MYSTFTSSLPSFLKSWTYGGIEGIATTAAVVVSLGLVTIVSVRMHKGEFETSHERTSESADSPAETIACCHAALKQYIKRCLYNMLASLAVIYAVCFHLQSNEAQDDVRNYIFPRAIAIVSTTNALSALYLTILFNDVVFDVVRSYESTRQFIETAESIRSKWLNMAVLLAMPFGWTLSAILSFLFYRVAAAVANVLGATDENSHNGGTYAATIVSLYVLLVAAQSALAAKIFVRLRAHNAVSKEN